MRINFSSVSIGSDGLVQLSPSIGSVEVECSKQFQDPESIAELFNKLNYDRRVSEYVWVLCLSSKGHLLDLAEISHGGINSSVLESREVFQRCLLRNAAHFILVHNHPSGDCTPSKEDLSCAERFVKAGRIMGIYLMDSIVIGLGSAVNYVSIREINEELFEQRR